VADTDSPLKAIAETWWTPPAAIVAKLPRVTCRDCSKGTCSKHQKQKCGVCSAWISTQHIHLDFVGHADLTRALIEIDPEWQWEPVAFDEDGLPRITQRGSMWVLWGRLTLLGKTMLCVGTCEVSQLKSDVDKELIGDLLRNGGMRFGIFGSLWSKTDGWHDDTETTNAPAQDEGAAESGNTQLNSGPYRTTPPEKPVDTMTVQELAVYAQTIGVPYKGSKAEMVYVLKSYEGAATGLEPFDTTPPENPPPPKDDHDKPFTPTVAGPSMAREALAGTERKAVDSAARTP
jgi:hypothetical protein